MVYIKEFQTKDSECNKLFVAVERLTRLNTWRRKAAGEADRLICSEIYGREIFRRN